MKKFGFGLIGFILIAAIYYFTSGTTRIVQEGKQRIDRELDILQQNGFSVKERKSDKRKEHFIVSFDEPEKIIHYLNIHGTEMTIEEARALKDLQIGIDATYLPESSSALSLDLYPVSLPKNMLEDLNDEEKQLIDHIKKMFERRALLLHIDFDRLFSGFKGYIRDINETIEEESQKVTIAAKGMTFKGSIEKGEIRRFSQKITLLSLDAGKELQARIDHISGSYLITGTTLYDATSHYHTGSIMLKTEPNIQIHIENIDNTIKNRVNNGLAQSSMKNKAGLIEISHAQQRYSIREIILDLTLDNLDIGVLEALQKTDPEDEVRIRQLTQQLLSKGIVLTLSDLSVGKITEKGIETEGFEMNGSIAIDKSLNINAASQNPMLALNALQIRTHISISNELYSLIVEDPRAMIFMMMAPPASQKGRKIYDMDFSNGKLKVNGISF